MKVDTEKLKTVANYAAEKEVSTTAVYTWMKQNKIKTVEIDGVKFIQVK